MKWLLALILIYTLVWHGIIPAIVWTTILGIIKWSITGIGLIFIICFIFYIIDWFTI